MDILASLYALMPFYSFQYVKKGICLYLFENQTWDLGTFVLSPCGFISVLMQFAENTFIELPTGILYNVISSFMKHLNKSNARLHKCFII